MKQNQSNIICIDDIKQYGKKNIAINRNCRVADTLVIEQLVSLSKCDTN